MVPNRLIQTLSTYPPKYLNNIIIVGTNKVYISSGKARGGWGFKPPPPHFLNIVIQI